jgi:hypothetical protein
MKTVERTRHISCCRILKDVMVYFYRYNFYMKRYYIDIADSNIQLHDNALIPMLPEDRCECGYCGYVFESRNALFRHLGAMNIDIRKKRNMNAQDQYDDDLGDEGFFFEAMLARRITRTKPTKTNFLRIISKISKLSV